MAMPPSPLARLGAFRTELHACFLRRADALFELSDALLCAQTPLPSLPHLSLEPVHRRGWGGIYAALASGRVQVERVPAKTRPPKVLWLWWVGPGELDLDLVCYCLHAVAAARGLPSKAAVQRLVTVILAGLQPPH